MVDKGRYIVDRHVLTCQNTVSLLRGKSAVLLYNLAEPIVFCQEGYHLVKRFFKIYCVFATRTNLHVEISLSAW